MTDYSALIESGRVKQGRFSRNQIDSCFQIAKRDLETSSVVVETSPEWVFNIAYNAMQQAGGRAFMFYSGYRSVGEAHHATVVRFFEIGLGTEFESIMAVMDRMRRKRNRATYDKVGTISRKEADEALSSAVELLDVVRRRVRKT
jgi:uncharacterized protein (UPF0332 family)